MPFAECCLVVFFIVARMLTVFTGLHEMRSPLKVYFELSYLLHIWRAVSPTFHVSYEVDVGFGRMAHDGFNEACR